MLKIVRKIVILLALLIATLVIGFTVLATLLVSHMDTDTTVKTITCLKETNNCQIEIENRK